MAGTQVEILRNDNCLLKWGCSKQKLQPPGNGRLLDSLDTVFCQGMQRHVDFIKAVDFQ